MIDVFTSLRTLNLIIKSPRPLALQFSDNLGRLIHVIFRKNFSPDSRTPWMSDQPVARPLPAQDNTTQKDEDKQPCLERD
jgi:hypothetical protein